MDLDLIIQNCTIVTAAEILPPNLSIGIKDGKISCIATNLPVTAGTRVIDAQGAYVTPGGVDSHVHIAQDNAPTGDNWESGTRSAICGGNTTLLAFASQKKSEESLLPVVEEYHRRANDQGYCDYGFHVIVSKPTQNILDEELDVLMGMGISSVKLYMTYPLLKLGDGDVMDVLLKTRAIGMTTMIHSENSDMIDMITKRLQQRGHNEPYYHSVARPQIAETEATYRAISMAELCDAPMLIVHMSNDGAIRHVRDAQQKGIPILAETCPQYLYLLSEKIAAPHFEGAKHVCAPPLRHSPADLDALWSFLAPPSPISVISSDHAPHSFAHPLGKLKAIHANPNPNAPHIPTFSTIPNGLPGLETRLPLLFNDATGPNPKISLPRFVDLTSTAAAKLYGLSGTKGSIAPGYDADLVIWYPESKEQEIVISQENLHHAGDYTPFEGMTVRNWPRWTILRGELVWDRDREIAEGKDKGIAGRKGFGNFLKRGRGQILIGKMGGTPAGMKEGERSLWLD